MPEPLAAVAGHRVAPTDIAAVCRGKVRWAPVKSLWFISMSVGGIVGGALTFTWSAFALYLFATGFVLLFGHSLGNHRKLVHDSFQCPRWLEVLLVYCGVQVGLAGPLGLLQQHDLRDFAQRLPRCHDYLCHGRTPIVDAWWQLNCVLELDRAPEIRLEPRLANDRMLILLERSWMLQQLPPALVFYAIGGWGFVFFGVCARIATAVFGHWLIGYLAHNHGELTREVHGAAVQGRNVRWTSLLTMGECWHNNHHAYPGSARLGLEPGEWDPGWWVLRGFERLGLVWSLRLPAHFPHRPELVHCAPTDEEGDRPGSGVTGGDRELVA
jgi:stearoyl-CoA desaturase (delta-9 desaturase)